MNGPYRQPIAQIRKRVSAALGYQVSLSDLKKYCAALEEQGLTIEDALAIQTEFNYMRLWFSLTPKKTVK